MKLLPNYRWSDVTRIAGLALAYALLAKGVLGVFPANGVVSLVWPPSGLALAALLIGGKKYWPGIFIGALAGNLLAGSPAGASIFIAFGNTLEGLTIVWLLAHFEHFDSRLTHFRDYLKLAIAGAAGACVSALIGVSTLVLILSLTKQAAIGSLSQWWQGDALGIFLGTPLILVWRQAPQGWFKHTRVVETIACFGLTFLVGQIIFLGWLQGYFGHSLRAYWIFLFITWAAIRFGRHGVLLIICMVSVQALLGAIQGVGFFSNDLAQYGLFNFWSYTLALTVVGITLSAVFEENRSTKIKAEERERHLQTIFETEPECVKVVDPNGKLLEMNAAGLAMLETTSLEEAQQHSLMDFILPEYRDAFRNLHKSVLQGETGTLEFEVLGLKGTRRWLETHAAPMRDEVGMVTSLLGVTRDITERKQAELRIARLTHLYKALSEINQAIVRMEQQADLFPLVCRCAVEFGGMNMAWIAIPDGESGLFIPSASYGSYLEYLDDIVVSSSTEVPEGRGPIGTAFRENRPVIVNDYFNSPLTVPWHARILQGYWRSAAAFPIQRAGKPFAVLSVYHLEINAFDEEAITLLEEMSTDISFALDNFDRESQRQLAQDKLQKTQVALMESHDRYMDLYEFAPIGYLSLNEHGIIIGINWKATAMFGLKRNLLLQHRLGQFVDEEDKVSWKRLFDSMMKLEEGKELNFDLKFVRDDGSTFNANLNTLRVNDESGQSVLRLSILDTTKIKKAEDAQRKSDQHFRAYFERSMIGMAETSPGKGWVEINDRLCEILGYSRDELTCMTWDEITHPEDLAAGVAEFNRVLAGEIDEYTSDKRFIHRDGHVVYAHVAARCIRLENGTIDYFVSLVDDISERIQAERFEQFRSRVLEILAQDKPLFNVLEAIVQGVEELNPKMLCSVLLLDNERKHLSKAVAPSLPDFYNTALDGIEIGIGVGSCGTAAFTGERVIVEDIATHSYWAPYKNLAESAGLGACWSQPILSSSGQVLGTFAIYQHKANNPTAFDIVLIEQTAHLASIAIERKLATEEIEHLAFYDPLTHLPNRRLLLDRLNHALASSMRIGQEGALLFLDLDNFKELNDSRGHQTGDLLLQQVTERLISCVREGDTVARIGGDEFVVILEGLSEQDIDAAAQTEIVVNKILAAINLPFQLAKYKHHCTASIGISLFKGHQSEVEELLKQADIAMYQAKKAGRNTFRFYNPQMQAIISARTDLELDLRRALEEQQFQLHYQIQVDNLGHPLGAEALIRWIHPERGLVSPAQFIPLAEETGLILPIGHWVLDTACAQIKAWHKNAQTRDLTLSINVSARQFRQPDFVAQVRAAIERHSIDPMQLKIELTESLLLENIEDTIVSMIALGEIGVQFSLDDFGTGYSSLQYLKKLPLFQLKIDQSFVRDIVTDSHDRSIVRTIIAMAQSLYLNVIAEGVETEQQRELLLSNGCKRYQGYLFGKPLPIDQFNIALKQD